MWGHPSLGMHPTDRSCSPCSRGRWFDTQSWPWMSSPTLSIPRVLPLCSHPLNKVQKCPRNYLKNLKKEVKTDIVLLPEGRSYGEEASSSERPLQPASAEKSEQCRGTRLHPDRKEQTVKKKKVKNIVTHLSILKFFIFTDKRVCRILRNIWNLFFFSFVMKCNHTSITVCVVEMLHCSKSFKLLIGWIWNLSILVLTLWSTLKGIAQGVLCRTDYLLARHTNFL